MAATPTLSRPNRGLVYRMHRYASPFVFLACCCASLAASGEEELHYNWRPGTEYGYALELKVETPGKSASEKGTARFRADPAAVVKEESTEEQGQGTGFFVNKNGYVLTCAHCVKGTSRLEVVLGDKKADATVIAVDKKHDTAIIKVDGSDWPTVALADSDHLELGEEVRAIGFPLSYDLGKSIKMTRGILSGYRGEGDDKGLLVDAAINHGNSGGPLVND
ncbi:MAG TPA: trypsin-like peptidase domain-containing protein, partial [Pirellulales bacterium]|nr:trypsin-like peptidase domain-containing protein [Pirellulales bacterium]